MSGFSDKPVAAISRDGRKLNLRHGPIDLIVSAEGVASEVQAACHQAVLAFETVLTDLVSELDLLRKPVAPESIQPTGSVAQAMYRATVPHQNCFVTPMAAVAGAVADHILSQMKCGRDLKRASVNNGGDLAIFLARDEHYDVGICSDPQIGTIAGTTRLSFDDAVRGVATSGWRGRSHSLGIADAVTVLARNAATADVAATLIANAVNVEHCSQIERKPACELAPDSDLGDQLVTVNVGQLSDEEIHAALSDGESAATDMWKRGLVAGAFLSLGGETRIVGDSMLAVQPANVAARLDERRLAHG